MTEPEYRHFRCERGHLILARETAPERCNAALLLSGRPDLYFHKGLIPKRQCGAPIALELSDEEYEALGLEEETNE